MPFQSVAQQKWMFANKSKMAKKWAQHTDFSKLPNKVNQLRALKNKLKNNKK